MDNYIYLPIYIFASYFLGFFQFSYVTLKFDGPYFTDSNLAFQTSKIE